MSNENNNIPQKRTELKPRGFSSKRNIVIIVIAALVVLGGIGAAVAVGASNRASQGADGFQLAEKYFSEQNYEQAIIAFEQILEIEPMNVDAYIGLADAYIGMGNTDKALKVLREGLEMTGDGRIQAKIDELTKVSESSPSSETSSADSSADDKLPYGSMGSVTIFGQEIDIATTQALLVYNKELYEADVWHCVAEDHNDSVISIEGALSAEELGKITQLSQLRSLHIHYAGLADISLLSGMTNLTDLCLDQNQISDLTPIAGLTNLRDLRFQHNQVADISPLSGFIELGYLNIADNQISDISPIGGLNKLEFITAFRNQISDIAPLAGLTRLKTLSLSYNQISDITPLAGLTNLTWLELSSNQITDVAPLKALTRLTSLLLDTNSISDITPLAGLKELTQLTVFGIDNNISNADMAWLDEQLPNWSIN